MNTDINSIYNVYKVDNKLFLDKFHNYDSNMIIASRH